MVKSAGVWPLAHPGPTAMACCCPLCPCAVAVSLCPLQVYGCGMVTAAELGLVAPSASMSSLLAHVCCGTAKS